MTIPQALQILRPKAEWVMRGHTYDCLEWLDKIQTKPSKEEVDEAIAAYSYQELRRPLYPTLADQLDAIWKGAGAFEEMQSKIMAIKAKYPKPE